MRRELSDTPGMAGWSIHWSKQGSWPERAKVDQSVLAGAQGSTVSEHWISDRLVVAAWRRGYGEFQTSGVVQRHGASQIAWVGQLLDDSGDATLAMLPRLADIAGDDRQLATLNGPFSAAIVNASDRSIRIVQDRFGHYPLYCVEDDRQLVVATDVRVVLPFLRERRLDVESLRMQLASGELIEDRTLISGVRMLLGGCVHELGPEGSLKARRYWRIRHQDGREGPPAGPAELGERLRTGVRRMEKAASPAVITLSGGLDSRLILDLTEHPERIPSFTWGLPACRDIECATEFAQLVHSPHTIRVWEPQVFPVMWADGVAATAGAVGVDSMFMLPYSKLLSEHGRFVYNGLAGDALLGGNFVRQSVIGTSDLGTLARQIWRWRTSERDEALADRLLPRPSTEPSPADRWIGSMTAEAGAAPMARICDWLIDNRVFRTTNAGTMLLRTHVESHSPFFDNEFFDALMKVPLRDRLHHRLYLDAMRAVAPRAGKARWQRTGIRPDAGLVAQMASRAFHAAANKVGSRFGFDPFPGLKVADVPGWMRGPWKSTLESLLFDARFLAATGVDADVLRATWQDHLQGKAATRQIAVLATAAHLQRLLDG